VASIGRPHDPQPRPDGYRYPDLLDGLVPPNVKNLFVFGVGQPRYGAGPLITAGAEAMAGLLKAQSKVRSTPPPAWGRRMRPAAERVVRAWLALAGQMKYPVGWTLRALGMRPLKTYLQDPVEVFNGAIGPTHLLPLVERALIALGYFRHAPEPANAIAAPS